MRIAAAARDIIVDPSMYYAGDIVAGGADTTAVSLSWFMVIMCHHPEVQERLRAEVDEFILANKRYPTFADRDSFPYMISVQKECIRYRPTTHFGLLHQATEDGKSLLKALKGVSINDDLSLLYVRSGCPRLLYPQGHCDG